jgi:hypothetical protein
VILAAALLTAAALGSAIAIGSGWLRLPLVIDTPSIPGETTFVVAGHYYDAPRGTTVLVREPTQVHARVRDGWTSSATGMIREPTADGEPALAVSLWAVDAVSVNPCDPLGRFSADPPMMRSLDGLADAFTAWWQGGASELDAGVDAARLPRSTDPVATSVSGWRARYLEIRIPDTAAIADCDSYVTWRNADGVERRHQPGDVSRIWIIEVGPPRGGRGPRYHYPSTPLLVIDASSRGEPSAEALAELEEIIDSLRIEAPRSNP